VEKGPGFLKPLPCFFYEAHLVSIDKEKFPVSMSHCGNTVSCYDSDCSENTPPKTAFYARSPL